jgi:hypothetical protein
MASRWKRRAERPRATRKTQSDEILQRRGSGHVFALHLRFLAFIDERMSERREKFGRRPLRPEFQGDQ